MDKAKLAAALEEKVTQKGSDTVEGIFVRLLKQVWQIDWTVAPYDVWTHMVSWDLPYFLRFMQMDVGDEAEEDKLILDWVSTRLKQRKGDTAGDWKKNVVALIDEMNQLRASIRKAS